MDFEFKCYVIHRRTGTGAVHVCCSSCFEKLRDNGECPLCRYSYCKEIDSIPYTVRTLPEGVEGYKRMEKRNDRFVLMDPEYEEIREVTCPMKEIQDKILDLQKSVRELSNRIDSMNSPQPSFNFLVDVLNEMFRR